MFIHYILCYIRNLFCSIDFYICIYSSVSQVLIVIHSPASPTFGSIPRQRIQSISLSLSCANLISFFFNFVSARSLPEDQHFSFHFLDAIWPCFALKHVFQCRKPSVLVLLRISTFRIQSMFYTEHEMLHVLCA